MGATTAKAKNNWSRNHYDRLSILVKKGEKEKLQKLAAEQGITVAKLFVNSLNAQYPGTLETLDGIMPSMRPRPSEAAAAPSGTPDKTVIQEDEAPEAPPEDESEDSEEGQE